MGTGGVRANSVKVGVGGGSSGAPKSPSATAVPEKGATGSRASPPARNEASSPPVGKTCPARPERVRAFLTAEKIAWCTSF